MSPQGARHILSLRAFRRAELYGDAACGERSSKKMKNNIGVHHGELWHQQISNKLGFWSFDWGKGCRKIVGPNPVLRGFILRSFVFRFFRNFVKVGNKFPAISRSSGLHKSGTLPAHRVLESYHLQTRLEPKLIYINPL